MIKIRPDSCMRVMNYDAVKEHEKVIVQIESALSHEGYKPCFLVEYGGSSNEELKTQFYEDFKEEFQKDKIELMGRKCSDWEKILKENDELGQKCYDLKNTILQIKAFFCLPEVPDSEKVKTFDKLKLYFEAYHG